MSTWMLLMMGLLLGQTGGAETSTPPATASADYVIGPEDLLQIEVFQLEELTKTLRVGQDGSVRFPLIGVVSVEGLTRSQLEAKLARLLEQRFVRDPQVTVFIQEYRSRRVSVLGAVQDPGSYELIGNKRLLDMLGMAGGLAGDAGGTLYLIRADSANRIEVDLEGLLREGRIDLNLEVLAGDVVNVPKIETITVYVFGEVEHPGAFEVDRERTVTVLQAVAMAGGLSRRASAGKVQVQRQIEDTGQMRIIKVNLKRVIEGKSPGIPLQDGDTVVVPRSFF